MQGEGAAEANRLSVEYAALCADSWSSLCFAAAISSCIAATCPFTSATLSAAAAAASPPPPPRIGPAVSRSAGIWYLRNSSVRSCVSRISLVRLSGGSRSSRSSCGLICTTSTPKRVLSSCIPRTARAKACCSGESDSIASRNSLGDGIASSSSGIRRSSLFCTMTPCLGSNVVADEIRPTSTTKLLNCRACADSSADADAIPLKLCRSHACRQRSPPNRTVVAALMANCIGAPAAARLTIVNTGSLIDPSACCSSMEMCPSGLCCSDLRTE